MHSSASVGSYNSGKRGSLLSPSVRSLASEDYSDVDSVESDIEPEKVGYDVGVLEGGEPIMASGENSKIDDPSPMAWGHMSRLQLSTMSPEGTGGLDLTLEVSPDAMTSNHANAGDGSEGLLHELGIAESNETRNSKLDTPFLSPHIGAHYDTDVNNTESNSDGNTSAIVDTNTTTYGSTPVIAQKGLRLSISPLTNGKPEEAEVAFASPAPFPTTLASLPAKLSPTPLSVNENEDQHEDECVGETKTQSESKTKSVVDITSIKAEAEESTDAATSNEPEIETRSVPSEVAKDEGTSLNVSQESSEFDVHDVYESSNEIQDVPYQSSPLLGENVLVLERDNHNDHGDVHSENSEAVGAQLVVEQEENEAVITVTDWVMYYNEDGWPYYYSASTGDSSWDQPLGYIPTSEAYIETDNNYAYEDQDQECSDSPMMSTLQPELKSDINASISYPGKSPLHAALETCMQVSLDMLLLSGMIDVDIEDENGITPLQTLCLQAPWQPDRQAECARTLLMYGANPNRQHPSSGETPVHLCITSGNASVLGCILEHGADMTYPDPFGETALNRAARLGHLDCMQHLLQAGAVTHIVSNRVRRSGSRSSHLSGSSIASAESSNDGSRHRNGHGRVARNETNSHRKAQEMLMSAGQQGRVRQEKDNYVRQNGGQNLAFQRAKKEMERREEERKHVAQLEQGDGWVEYFSNDGQPYYHNKFSGQVTWEVPDRFRREQENAQVQVEKQAHMQPIAQEDIYQEQAYYTAYTEPTPTANEAFYSEQAQEAPQYIGMETNYVDAYGRRIVHTMPMDAHSPAAEVNQSYMTPPSKTQPHRSASGIETDRANLSGAVAQLNMRNTEGDDGNDSLSSLSDNGSETLGGLRPRGNNKQSKETRKQKEKDKETKKETEEMGTLISISTKDMTNTSASAETEKHLNVWNRFFQNAFKASEMLSSPRSNGVGGFTPRIARVERGKWPDPPTTEDYEAMISIALATTQGEEVDKHTVANLNLALLAASMHADAEIMEMLLMRGANHSCVDDQIRSPTHHAARISGDNGCAAVALLADCGADVEARDLSGKTPLHVAAMVGNGDVLQFLLECAVDVEATDDNGETPLHLAAGFGHNECCRLLVEFGASVRTTNRKGMSPMGTARQARPKRRDHAAVMETLASGYVLEAGEEVVAQTSINSGEVDESNPKATTFYNPKAYKPPSTFPNAVPKEALGGNKNLKSNSTSSSTSTVGKVDSNGKKTGSMRPWANLRIDTSSEATAGASPRAAEVNKSPLKTVPDSAVAYRINDARAWKEDDLSPRHLVEAHMVANGIVSKLPSENIDDDDVEDQDKSTSAQVTSGVWNIASSLIGSTLKIFSGTSDGSAKSSPSDDTDKGVADIWATSAAPPTDAELRQYGLGFAQQPPAIVADEINSHIHALRSGLTPRRSQTPHPPAEVVVALSKSRNGTPASLHASGGSKGSNGKSNRSLPQPLPLPNLTVDASPAGPPGSVPPMSSNQFALGQKPLSSAQRYVDVFAEIRTNSK
jgi:ankyrin repeat protein